MKCYRYLIYKLYSWALKKKNDTPIFNVIITLTAVHYFQLLLLYCILLKAYDMYNVFSVDNSLLVGIFSILFLLLNYLVFYNKERWLAYMKEFENENKRESKKGTFYVLCYLIGSIVLFFISLPILFG